MSKIDITKKIVAFVVGAGTTKIVAGVVANNTSPKSNYDIVTIVMGSAVIGAMLAEKCKQYTDRQMDAIVQAWNEYQAEKTTTN